MLSHGKSSAAIILIYKINWTIWILYQVVNWTGQTHWDADTCINKLS